MQIYDLLKERIESGYYPPGSRLPKEVDLATDLKVARITLRPALELLEMEKLISRIKGRGTFVHDRGSIPKIRLLVLFAKNNDISNPFIYISPCMQTAAERMNVHLEFYESVFFSLSPDQSAEQIRTCGFHGILWLASNFTGSEPMLEIVRKTGLPVLLVHADAADAEITGFTTMTTNYKELIKDGLKYLAAQGHRRTAHVTNAHMRGIDFHHYLQWVRDAGMDPDPKLLRRIPSLHNRKEYIFKAMDHLMELKDRPTAILSYSDVYSLMIYEYLHRSNIRIPEDVAVLTIGGQIGCNFLNPPLSALEYGNQEIADDAIRVMLEMIHDRRREKLIVTPHRLVVRESTRRILFHHPVGRSAGKRKKDGIGCRVPASK